MFKIFILAIIIFSASVSAQSLTGAIHTFKHGSSEQIARQIFELSSQKLSYSQLQQLFELLDDKSSLKKIGCKSEVRDISILIFQEISRISASRRNRQVKAIISFKHKTGKVYRYHLSDLKDKEINTFKEKIHDWLLKKIPA